MGRGGSDTTAVAIAAALGADACEIYTDVDGVYTADPRIVPSARKLKEISYDEMQDEMSDKLKTDEFYEPERKTSLLDELFAKAGSLVPKSEAQVLKETAEECKSGGLMYYAEGLQ